MMLTVYILLVAASAAFAGYSGSSSNSVNGGYGYGYSGSFAGNGDNIPSPPVPQFDFGALGSYFDSLQKYHENFINNIQQQAQYAAVAPSVGTRGSFGGGYGGSFSGADGGALASASIGPGGYHQTAAVYPENPNNPNIFTRFGGGGGGGGAGNYGVFTSSVSSSSNLDGTPQHYHRATTTVNDNGKVTTYTVKNP